MKEGRLPGPAWNNVRDASGMELSKDSDDKQKHVSNKLLLLKKTIIEIGSKVSRSKVLEYIAENTSNYCNDILHASHHGSLNGAQLNFIRNCNAEYTLISTRAGVHSNIPHPTALSRYRAHTRHNVRRTDVDGSWRWDF